MAPSERVVLPLRIGKQEDLHLPDVTRVQWVPEDGETPLETAQRIAGEFAGLPATHVMRESGMADNLRASYLDKPEVLVQRERTIMGKALRLGKRSLWQTIERVPVDARNTG